MASRTPQRTDIELPSGAVATVRKAMSRDMSRAEQAKTRSIRMSLVDGYDDAQVSKLKLFQSDTPRGNDDDEKLDPDRMMLESHDAETLVDACTVGVDFPEPIEDGGLVSASLGSDDSWMDILDADDHEALFEAIMWFSRVKPSLKKA